LRKTGGSTGRAVAIYYSDASLDMTAAVNRYVLGWAGRDLSQREVHLASQFPEKFPIKDRLREQFKCAALNRRNIFTTGVDDEALEKIWRQLRRAKPYLVQAHPSTFYALSSYLQRKGIDASGVLAVFESTGEVLDPAKRAMIEDVFGCRVVNRYGNAEFGVVAYESPDARDNAMKFLEPVVYSENVGGEDKVPEIILTGLGNHAMPLVRYQTGDLGIVRRDSTGQAWLGQVVGRSHDVVRIGDKLYPTHYVQDLLDRVGGVLEFQLVLMKPDQQPVLRIVADETLDIPSTRERIAQWWGKDLTVEFIGFDQLLQVGNRGKFRYLVNAVET
jgi:phenylacetate-CoA ligase